MRLAPWMARWRRTWRCLLGIAAITPCALSAQSVVTEDWPELDIFWRPTEHQRTMLELSAVAERESAQCNTATLRDRRTRADRRPPSTRSASRSSSATEPALLDQPADG